MMRVTVIGTGYVGLVTGVCLADLGLHVTCVDKQASKIDALKQAQIPIFEPGLEALVKQNMQAGRLHFTTDLAAPTSQADIVMIAVGTPPDKSEAGKADLQYVFAAAKEIAPALSGYSVVVTKSTVPVGTNTQLQEVIANANPQANFDVASNPEFLREGTAIHDFMTPDRIVVGTQTDKAAHSMHDLYQPLTNKGYPLLRTNIETAEMIKYASNSFLATKIAFINEMADICEHVGANVELVAKGMGMDERIGERFLKPGPGFGGSCFPKDALALARLAEDKGVDPKIINTVIHYNLNRRDQMAQRIMHACGGSVHGKTIAILGLTFKANTDDMRESCALNIIPSLIAHGANICAHDPEGMPNAKALLPTSVSYANSAAEACENADCAAILTEWDAYKQLNFEQLKDSMHSPILVDLRNLYLPNEVGAKGFNYHSIGRKSVLGLNEAVSS